MENKNYTSVGLTRVLALLSAEAALPDTKAYAENLIPAATLEEAQLLLQETYDAHALIGRFGSPSFGGIQNTTNALRRAQAGAILTPLELLRIAAVLHTIRTTVDWRSKSASIQTVLDNRFYLLTPNKFLEEKIRNIILSEDEIADSASPELATIRRKMSAAAARIREQLDKILRSSEQQKYLQDNLVTMRGGRYVIPVKAEFRSQVAGLVHDTSASHATVFIEPISVVEANNDIKVLQSKEQAEIERILAELSAQCGGYADNIINSYRILTELDLIFAKASLAYKMKASLPILNANGIINIKKARHPLIDFDKVVPTDIELGKSFDTLVITGPNTGGKTVSLKTVGLFSLMAMCGLMIPAADNSELSFFTHILADIGDEQSIEQSLSTFSAHIVNLVKIMDTADENSLVLLDELCTGTDPVEGAALAISILEQLRRQGAKIIATTHYAELKSYAIETNGVENGCCEFDVTTLRPTYRLLIGIPGRSNAFAISRRLGLNNAVVDAAQELVSNENIRFEKVVGKLEENRTILESKLKEAETLRLAALDELSKAQTERQNAEREVQKILAQAHSQADELVTKTRSQALTVLDEAEALRKQREKAETEQKSKLKAAIRNMENAADPIQHRTDDNYQLPRKLRKGDAVLIFDIDKKGTVLDVDDTAQSVTVQAGLIKTRVPIKNIRLLKNETIKKPQQSVGRTVRRDVQRTASTEVDLRGETAEEALLDLDKAIDSAILMGLHQLTIIHGKGTGVLRREVQAHLKRHPSIRSYRLGVYGEGESGVTIAELK